MTSAKPETADRYVAAYVRVSSEEQVENTSLESQTQTCNAAALLKDDPLPRLYREEGMSGTTADRPEWQRLLGDCRAGKVKRIYALNWSRLARDAAVGTQIVKELKALGVELTVVEQDFDSKTLMGDFLQKLMILLAELDRNALVDRMARGQHAMAARNLWPSGGASPYGYRATGGRTNTLLVHQDEAAVLRQVVGWIIDEGLTTGDVCRRLNAAGTPTRMGKQWAHPNLRRILRQRVLVGEVMWADTEKTHRSYLPSGRYGPPVQLRFPPIIDEGRYAALQIALDVRATGKRAENKPYPLSGRLFSPCGQPYGGVYRKDRDLRQYRCRARQWSATGASRCTDRLLSADDVESRVWAEVLALLSNRTRLLSMAQDYLGLRVQQIDVEQDELTSLQRRTTKLKQARGVTLIDLLRRGFDADAIERATQAIDRDMLATRKRLAEVEAWAADSANESRHVMSVWQLAETAGTRLSEMAPNQQTEVLALLDVRVTVLDSSARPSLRVEGVVCAQRLLEGLTIAGDVAVAGTLLGGPHRR